MVKIYFDQGNYDKAWDQYLKAFNTYNSFYNIEFYDINKDDDFIVDVSETENQNEKKSFEA
jgi:hypothetical protein